MSYFATSLGQIPFHQSGGAPFGMPMPIQAPGPGIPGPTMPTSIYPTSGLRWGDPVTVTGPFAGRFQGNVRVKFAGAPWQAPAILGPFQATVQVPDGAQTGACMVEIDGRVTFGTTCSVVPGGALRGRLSERKDTVSWKDFGPKTFSGMGAFPLIPPSPASVLQRQRQQATAEKVRQRNLEALDVAAKQAEAAAAAPVAPEMAPPARFPVLLIAGIGAAALLGYLLLRSHG